MKIEFEIFYPTLTISPTKKKILNFQTYRTAIEIYSRIYYKSLWHHAFDIQLTLLYISASIPMLKFSDKFHIHSCGLRY